MGQGDRYRFQYDPYAAMKNVPKLLGMELREHGRGYQGGYYLNGDLHAYRKDKLKVFSSRGGVWISEEGGRCISLPAWLVEFGGAADFKDALRMIRGESQAVHWNHEMREKARKELKFVSRDVLEAAKKYPLESCPLFRWMCGLFPEERVREAWDRYNITTDGQERAVYWYVNQDGKILFDKRLTYREDGHRDKAVAPGRQFRVGDGYSARCYFGACIPTDGKKAFLCESEKSAVLGWLYYGRKFLATGGKGNLRDVGSDVLLMPDYDARDEWQGKGEVYPWWEKWQPYVDEIPPTADIGDYIEWKLCASGTAK